MVWFLSFVVIGGFFIQYFLEALIREKAITLGKNVA